MWKADTGGWWDVCSVRKVTRVGFEGVEVLVAMVQDWMEAGREPLSRGGRVFSTSQLHYWELAMGSFSARDIETYAEELSESRVVGLEIVNWTS
jgi:hypothetical protein